jgi:hypothetical protein
MRFTVASSLAAVAFMALSPSLARAGAAAPSPWRARLEDPSPEARQKAAGELVAMGRKAIPILREVYAGGKIAESSPLWKELDTIGKELAVAEASRVFATGPVVASSPVRVVTEAGGFRTLAGYLACREGSLGHWTFTVADASRYGPELIERAVVVDDLSDESFVPTIVRTFDDVVALMKKAPAMPAGLNGDPRLAFLCGRARTALDVIRLTRSPAHSNALYPAEGTKESWRRGYMVTSSKAGTDELSRISMQLGHDWYDIVLAFDVDGRIERIAAKVTASCD